MNFNEENYNNIQLLKKKKIEVMNNWRNACE